jgi:hypothetical protein
VDEPVVRPKCVRIDLGGGTITDFAGNGPSAGDSHSADRLVHDIITLSNNASVHANDYALV